MVGEDSEEQMDSEDGEEQMDSEDGEEQTVSEDGEEETVSEEGEEQMVTQEHRAREFSVELCTALNALLRGQPLFPSLLEIFVILSLRDDSHMSVFLPLVLCSSLRRIDLSGRWRSPAPLLLASRFAPQVTTLEMWGCLEELPPPLSSEIILMQVMAFTFLETLGIHGHQDKWVRVQSSVLHRLLGALPHLKELDIDMVTPIGSDSIRTEDEAIACPHLESFKLAYTTYRSFPESHLERLPLIKFVTNLYIELPHNVSSHSVALFMSAASGHRLQDVTISCDGGEFDLSIFLPLLSSKNLQTIGLCGGFSITHNSPGESDCDFSNLVVGAIYPNGQSQSNDCQLRNLSLRVPITPLPTLQDLAVFAEKLPYLETLCIPLSLDDNAVSSFSLPPNVCFDNAVKRFWVNEWDPADAWDYDEDEESEPLQLPLSAEQYLPLARCVNSLFPNLESFSNIKSDKRQLVEEMRQMIQENERLKKRLKKDI
jgi:hypothetical protein